MHLCTVVGDHLQVSSRCLLCLRTVLVYMRFLAKCLVRLYIPQNSIAQELRVKNMTKMACEGLILPCETKRNETRRISDILYSAQHGNQQQQDKK